MARSVKQDTDLKRLAVKRSLRLALAVTVPLSIVGCSAIPDALNPAEWYRDTIDYIADDDGPQQETEADKAQAAAVGSTEEETVREQQSVQEGLVADTSQGRYSDENLTRQGEAMSPLQPEGKREVAQVKPLEGKVVPALNTAAPAQPQAQVQLTQPAPMAKPQSLQEIYKAALAQKRPYATSPAMPATTVIGGAPAAPQVATASMPYQGSSLETVIISSSGVHSGGAFNARFLDKAPTGTPTAQIIPAAITQDGANPLGAFNPSSATQSYKIATIQFGVGSANLSSEDRAILRKVANLQKNRGGTLRVVGHASSRTRNMEEVRHNMVNLKTSTDRADMVAKTLMRLGVAPTTLYVGALSDADPVYYEVMPSGEAGNRRAEVYIDF